MIKPQNLRDIRGKKKRKGPYLVMAPQALFPMGKNIQLHARVEAEDGKVLDEARE